MRRLALALLLVPSLSLAAPVSLTSTVTRAPLEPAVLVVPANAGTSTLERYRARTPPVSGTPLVVIARLPEANSPDVIAVKQARRDGAKISIAIETRKYQGPLGGNAVTTPFVEVALGNLPTGTYQIEITEQVLGFTKYDAPATASKPHRGFASSITLTIQ